MKKFKAAALGLLILGSVALTGCFSTDDNDYTKCLNGELAPTDQRCSTGSK